MKATKGNKLKTMCLVLIVMLIVTQFAEIAWAEPQTRELAEASLSPVTLDNGSNGTIDGYYDTVGDAVYDADPGATVKVYDGEYNESVCIDKANLTLQSVNGAEKTKIVSSTDDEAVFYVTVPGVTIEGFTIAMGAQYNTGVIFAYDFETEQGATSGTIRNNIFTGTQDYWDAGVEADMLSEGDFVVENNSFSDVVEGIYIRTVDHEGNIKIISNEFSNVGNAGISVREVITDNSVSIQGNSIDGGYGGIMVGNIGGYELEDCYTHNTINISGNTIRHGYSGIDARKSRSDSGIGISEANFNAEINIENNNITDGYHSGVTIGYLGAGNSFWYKSLGTEAPDAVLKSMLSASADLNNMSPRIMLPEEEIVYWNNPDFPDYQAPRVEIKNNTITGNVSGIYQMGDWAYGAGVNVEDNQINDNSGAALEGRRDIMHGVTVKVSGNQMSNNFGGIVLGGNISDQVQFDVTDNTINSSIAGVYLLSVDTPQLLERLPVEAEEIIPSHIVIGPNNIFSDNGLCGVGLLDFVSGVKVWGNTIENNASGVFMLGSNNEVVGNYIFNNTMPVVLPSSVVEPDINAGVFLSSTASDNLIHYNDFISNSKGVYTSEFGYYANAVPKEVIVAQAVYAQNNWWGSLDGPNRELTDSVTANVLYSPWITKAKFNNSRLNLHAGKTGKLILNGETQADSAIQGEVEVPVGAVLFSSSDPAVATVSEDGTVTAISNGTAIIKAHFANNPAIMVNVKSNSSGSSASGSPETGATGTDVLTAGNEIPDPPKVTMSQEKGQSVANVTINESQALASLAANPKAKVMVIPVTQTADVIKTEISSGLLKELANEGITVLVQAPSGSYALPVPAIKADELAAQFGVSVSELVIKVTIAKPTAEVLSGIKTEAEKNGWSVISAPLEFTVEVTAGNRGVEIKTFGTYITREINLPSQVEPNRTVAVVHNPDGSLTSVPTWFRTVNGHSVAVIRRRSNSIYTVVEHEKTFGDITGHWAKDDINLLASKLIVSGMTEKDFSPDSQVTRAQFSALVVKALGLEQNKAGAKFADIKSGDWYSGFVGAAAEAGIINGYADGSFRPMHMISRQEAAAILTQALNVAEIDTKISTTETISYLDQFEDKQMISSWAANAVAVGAKNGLFNGDTSGAFAPVNNTTRAEAVVMIKQMLTKAKFI